MHLTRTHQVRMHLTKMRQTRMHLTRMPAMRAITTNHANGEEGHVLATCPSFLYIMRKLVFPALFGN